MSFLVPAALFGFALLTIPVIVHLFKPRRVRQTPFSSLRWLHLTQQRMARRIQWHQVLLFAVRAAFLSLLVLALARPLYSSKGPVGSRDRILVIDVSGSMVRQVEGRQSPITQARQIASTLLRSVQPGERVAILLTGSRTKLLAPWSTDAAGLIAAVDQIDPTASATQLDSSFELLHALLDDRRDGAEIQISYITDNNAGSWSPSAIAEFVATTKAQTKEGEPTPTAPRFELFDVGLPAPKNAWLGSARVRQTPAGPVLRVEAHSVGDQTVARSLTVTGISGVEPVSVNLELPPGKKTHHDLSLPSSYSPEKSQARLVIEPRDELPDDDELFVDLSVSGGASVLIVETSASTEASQRPGFALRTAIQSLSDAGEESGDVNVRTVAPNELTADDVTKSDLFVLMNAAGLTPSRAGEITERVRRGAGILLFLGHEFDASTWNLLLTNAERPADGLLPVRLGIPVQPLAADQGLAGWGRWNSQHFLLDGLLDPLLGDLATTQSRQYWKFQDDWLSSDERLASFPDGTAALVVRNFGEGRIAILNGTANDQFSDLSRKKSFLPLIDRLIQFLSPSGTRRVFASSEPIQLLVADAGDDPLLVRSPSNAILSPRVERTAEKARVRLEGTEEAGFYTVLRGDSQANSPEGNFGEPVLTFVVQPSRRESPLAALESEILRSWWAPWDLEVHRTTASAEASSGDGRLALDPFLLMLASGLFAVEMFLVHWLCPRMNPALAASSGRRKGFVAPLKLREESAQP